MILLLLKTSIVIAVVLAFYKIVIEKESFFATNRVYFILGLILTFTIPFVTLPELIKNQGLVSNLIEKNQFQENTIPITPDIKPVEILEEGKLIITDSSKENKAVEIPIVSSQISLYNWLFYGYLFGVIVLSINLISQIIVLLVKVLRSNDKIKNTDAIIINSATIKEPCSFFNCIFINPEQYEFEIYEQIIAHEKIHVKKRHSIDLLLSEIAVIILWFNPFIWLFRKEVEKNIEYQTDNLFLDTNAAEKDSYQMNLLKIATFNKPLMITTNYNQSLIKQRILKMNKKKSNPHSYWKYAFTMPLFFAVLLFLNKPYSLLAQQNPKEKQVNEVANIKEIDGFKQDTIANESKAKITNLSNKASSNVISACKVLLNAIRANDVALVKTLLKSTDVNCIDNNPGYTEYTKNGHRWKIEKAKTPLFAAARTGNLEIAKALIAKGADVQRIVRDDGTALITAAEFGQLDFVKYMLEQGADLKRSFPNQGNALIAAAGNGYHDIVKYLIFKGIDINHYSPNQGNALIAASNNGNIETVKLLLNKKMDIHFISPNQGNAIIAAANNGHLETVKYLITQGADIHKIAPNQGTPLIAASNNGHLETVKYLIFKGAKTSKVSPNHGTALIAASNNGYQNVVALLVANGANVNSYSANQGSALNAASNNGHIEVVKYLIKEGADINTQSNGNGSALISASKNGQIDNVTFLIDNGANVNANTDGSGSALIAAAKNGHNSTIKLLLANGADINLQNDGSGSALVAAAKNGLLTTVKLLLSKGANVNGHTDGSGSALIAASKNGLHDMIELLLKNGADINLENDGSGFALNVAAKNGHLDTVKLLIKKGANVNLHNSGSGTALSVASKNGHKDIMEYLISKGAKHIYSN